MSSLNGSTLVLFSILSPGFLFLFSFYSFGKLTREDYQYGLVFDLGAIVVISLLSHIVCLPIYFWSASKIIGINNFWAIIASLIGNYDLYLIQSYPSFLLSLWFYPVFVCFIAALVGGIIIISIERRWIRFSDYIGSQITHGPIYEAAGFSENADTPTISVSILTNITFNGRYVIYSGEAIDIVIGSSNKISSVVIRNPIRRLVKIKDDTFDVSDDKHNIKVHDYPDTIGYIFISEKNILNSVVFKKETEFYEKY